MTGPFTAESLSPHRVLGTDLECPETERKAQRQTGPGQFETMILDNLRTPGVQNTVKNERLRFNRLEPHAGAWIQAVREYTENGKVRRAAVSIGPEHGTVGPELVKEAAKEICRSGLWNVRHIDEGYDARFLNRLERFIRLM